VIKDGMKILDIGSGTGYFKVFFDSRCKEKLNWHGIEIWKERAEFCKHLGYKIKEVNQEKGDLGFEDEYFDIVIASHVIEHIPNPKGIIKEMGRVIKKGGIFIIATPTKFPGIAELDSFYHRISKRNTGETQRAFTHKRLEKLTLAGLGLDRDSIIDKRGFRILSGRKKLPFENWKWFYQINKYLGKRWLYLVPEVNIIIRK